MDNTQRTDTSPGNDSSAKVDVNEPLPIKEPLKVLDHCTINKKFGWWAAVVIVESYAKRQICFYLWQKKDGVWKRKQKFGIHSAEDWNIMKTAVESFVKKLDTGVK